MLPGIAGLAGRVGGKQITTVFYKAANLEQIAVPSGITSVRFTGIGNGGYGFASNGTYYSGGGGGFAQGVFAVAPGQTFFVEAGSGVFGIRNAANERIVAGFGGSATSGGAGIGGSITYAGGNGTSSADPGLVAGGGSAGPGGPGGSANGGTPGARGPGSAFTQTSNGEVAVNASGAASGNGGAAYGGGSGGASGLAGGPGIVIIEWGYEQ